MEAQYRDRVLLTIETGENNGEMTLAALLDVLEEKSCVRLLLVCIEVATPPRDLWLTFTDGVMCTHTLEFWFSHWNHVVCATPDSLDYKTTVSFEGLPGEVYEPEAVMSVLTKLGGELIEIRP